MRIQYRGPLFIWLLWLSLFMFQCSEPVQTEPVQEGVSAELVINDAGSMESAQGEPPDGLTLEFEADQLESPNSEPIKELPRDITPMDFTPEQQTQEPRSESQNEELIQEKQIDNGGPRKGFGVISGDCGVLDDAEWKSSKPFLFRNTIDFGATPFDEKKLTPGGQKIWKDGNLGGSSVHSEIFAYEILYRCELSVLLKSEGEIKYKNTGGKKTDMLLEIDTYKIGVSVTRAYQFPPTSPYTIKKATTLLTKKLGDIPLSATNAATQDAWSRSILHILAYNKQHADTVEAAYKMLDAKIKTDIILIVTVTDGKDEYIYKN